MRGNGYSQGPSQSQAGQGHGQGQEYRDYSQPENALDFGDDDDWEKELGDFDMEEAMSSSVSTQAAVPVGNNDPTQVQAATNPDQSNILQEPQEIEERDFLPTGQPGVSTCACGGKKHVSGAGTDISMLTLANFHLAQKKALCLRR